MQTSEINFKKANNAVQSSAKNPRDIPSLRKPAETTPSSYTQPISNPQPVIDSNKLFQDKIFQQLSALVQSGQFDNASDLLRTNEAKLIESGLKKEIIGNIINGIKQLKLLAPVELLLSQGKYDESINYVKTNEKELKEGGVNVSEYITRINKSKYFEKMRNEYYASEWRLKQFLLSAKQNHRLSKNELAFMVLHGFSEKEALEIRTLCSIKESDDLQLISAKVMSTDKYSQLLEKAKKSIVVYGQYIKEKEKYILYEYLRDNNSNFFTQHNNAKDKIIARAFEQTIRNFKDSKAYSEYFKILEKYKIQNPLGTADQELEKMTTYEETIFSKYTEIFRLVSLSNLNFREMEEYLGFEKAKGYFLTQRLKEFSPKFAALMEREYAAGEILTRHDSIENYFPKIIGLTKKAQELIAQYQSILSQLSKTRTKDEVQEAQKKYLAIRKSINEEINQEFLDAYIDTPTESEKKHFEELLAVLSKLKIADDDLIYYSRLINPALDDSERQQIIILRDLQKKGAKLSVETDPLSFRKETLDLHIKKYPQDAQNLLIGYAQQMKDSLTNSSKIGRNIINSGHDKSAALFYILESIGIPEKELLFIDAIVAYNMLGEESKKLLNGSLEEVKAKCLAKEKEIDNLASEVFARMTSQQKELLNLEYALFSSIFHGLIGNDREANALEKTSVKGYATGSILLSEMDAAESTPEEIDDILLKKSLTSFFQHGLDNFGLQGINIIYTHIQARLILGKPIDEQFVDNILEYSSLGELMSHDGIYGLHDFKEKLVKYVSSYDLEYDLNKKDKTNSNQFKNEIIKWLENFIEKEISSQIQKNPISSGSTEMQNKMNILGIIYKVLIDNKIFDDKELHKFMLGNPIIPIQKKLSYKNFKSRKPFHTIGFEGIPQEIKNELIKDPISLRFVKQHRDLLNIIWVPREAESTFLGYAPRDKNTFVIAYSHEQTLYQSSREILGTLIHELQHKVDMRENNNYRTMHPAYDIYAIPLFITERNAYLQGYKYDKRNGISYAETKGDESRFKIANLLCGLSENDTNILRPPYDKINVSSEIIDVQPGHFRVNLKDTKKIKSIIEYLGYNGKEKQWLLEQCLIIFTNTLFNLEAIPQNKRHLFVEFLFKLVRIKDKGINNFKFFKLISNLKDHLVTFDKKQIHKFKKQYKIDISIYCRKIAPGRYRLRQDASEILEREFEKKSYSNIQKEVIKFLRDRAVEAESLSTIGPIALRALLKL